MIKAGIIGGTGYTGGELIRLLLQHPEVELAFVQSQSQAGHPLYAAHPDLLGETSMCFSAQWTTDIEVLFLCLPHEASRPFLAKAKLPPQIKIIDLSRDFRYTPEGFTYGLPELSSKALAQCQRVANPGCFATAIQLALLPLAKAQLLSNSIHIHAITGATGAGKKALSTTHFSWRNNNISIYKAFEHQHLDEIATSLQQLQGHLPEINFIPLRGDFPRGIFASIYTEYQGDLDILKQLFDQYYQDHPFVWRSTQNPDLKQVVNTNKCILHLSKHGNKLLIVSILDNLLKGASGQAVQNMNLMFGWPETVGLQLKASVF